MDPQASPPKRMTRARAAKAGESSTAAKATKIVTAAAKAIATRSTATSSTKRKTRADEVEDDEDNDLEDELAQPEPVTKTRTRGRPKQKAAEPPPEVEAAPATRPRGRPKKVAEPSKEEPQATKPATRTTRTKKATQPEAEAPAEPTKKPATRTRGSATAPTKSTAAKSATAKKTVKFEEPEKENIEPVPAKTTRGKAAETATTGLRAKPVRRAAASSTTARASTRAGATKTSGQESKYEKPTPLSPKKVTQMAMHNRATAAESEDELAADEKTAAKPKATKALAGVRGRGGMKLQAPQTGPKPPSDENRVENEVAVPTVMLGSPCRRPPPSPWKDSLKTPAKRVDGVPSLAQSAVRPPSRLFEDEAGQQRQQPQSAFKTSLLASPAKRPHSPIKGLDLRPTGGLQLGAPSPFKTSLLSPPKRPASPSKPSFLAFSSPRKQQEDETVFGRSPALKPTLLATPLAAESSAGKIGQDEEDVAIHEDVEEHEEEEPCEPNRLLFPGRMSAVLPRHADPALDQEECEHEELHAGKEDEDQQPDDDDCVDLVADKNHEVGEHVEDPMHLDGPDSNPEPALTRSEREATTTPPASPPKQQTSGFFGLREKDLSHVHDQDTESEDEDELATTETVPPATPCPPTSLSKGTTNAMSVRSANFGERSTVKRARTDNKFGFTPLADKLSAWGVASSPLKIGRPVSPGADILSQEDEKTASMSSTRTSVVPSPMRNDYFDEAAAQTEVAPQADGADAEPSEEHIAEDHSASEPMETADDGVLTPEFDDIVVTEEDANLAAEADEMSLMEPGQVEDMLHSDALSEASEEYGDENAIPIDPTLLVPPTTPQRNFTEVRHVHTVSKVPTKPADDSTPRPRIKRRGHSISRLPVQQRPTHGLQRNATVISYSPTKQPAQLEVAAEERGESAPPPVTPAKSEWSTAATPARTPRRDLNPALLGGAVVFVDVHTSEGADASGIFVELLSQMGARCVKTWSWNPSSPPSNQADGAGSRIGITHVVYKDGGKRTLEKVRESAGVVQCVGVSWVLE